MPTTNSIEYTFNFSHSASYKLKHRELQTKFLQGFCTNAVCRQKARNRERHREIPIRSVCSLCQRIKLNTDTPLLFMREGTKSLYTNAKSTLNESVWIKQNEGR